MKVEVRNLDELEKFCFSFLKKLHSNESMATVVLLSGDLGSGKTAFVKKAAKYFGVKETITSPTFVILKRFKLNAHRYTSLVHIDAYRLEKEGELLKLGWSELITDPQNIIFLEWPENIKKIIPETAKKLKFSFVDEETRVIDF